MTAQDIIMVAGHSVMYNGEGMDRHWFTILTRGFETTMCLKNCRLVTLTRAINAAVARYEGCAA
jgi:hypothetical protein